MLQPLTLGCLSAGALIALASDVIAVPLVFSLVLAGLPGPSGDPRTPADGGDGTTSLRPAWSRTQLVDALERVILTGEPRHVTHDEGQDLDEALKQALASGADAELQWLATRAAVPIAPAILRPLSSRTRPGALNIRTDRVFTLPWAVEYVADIEGRVDGGPWRTLLRVNAGVSENRSLDKLLPKSAAIAPGFHALSLRARIRYAKLPAGLPRQETRDLATVHYGVWGSARSSTDAVRPFFDVAASVSGAQLDPALPDEPLSSWLASLPHDAQAHAVLDWHTEWCSVHESMSDEKVVPADVCVVARREGPRPAFTEIWMKVGALRSDRDLARWVRQTPTLVAAYLVNGVRVRVPLSAVSNYLAQPIEAWPSARLVVNAAGITVASPIVVPGVSTALRVLIANMGDADATGVNINVLVASERDLPALHRTFVRTIRAGGTVEIETPVTFPAGYGFVDVMVVPGHDEIGPRTDPRGENHHAMAVINQRAAPAGYLQRICLEAGRAADNCAGTK